ncbi:unnamed protein product [Acanthoscelides obtectus]|uniref:Uncharacterized protein n=1 Tax=Acanthoscelides obtectus TaxID=200917 RepID=A0A9P0KVX5_ACAOB|nr:unnamed protein product [Acanthoscelides obtectus]CAK1628490.1 hypothetical protein AOBTE_LOCUS5243 [Acanthoscelides obtectus]
MSEKRKRHDFSDSDSDQLENCKIKKGPTFSIPQSDVFTTPDHSDDDDVPLSVFAARNADAVDSEVVYSCITNITTIEDLRYIHYGHNLFWLQVSYQARFRIKRNAKVCN